MCIFDSLSGKAFGLASVLCKPLPPCVPRAPKVYDKSEHPHMAHIQVQVLDIPKKNIKKDTHKISRTTDFIVLPEFKGPLMHKAPAAVAGSSASCSSIYFLCDVIMIHTA